MSSTTLKGLFQITSWDESAYAEHNNGSKQTIAKITQSYSGDIVGTANIHYVMSHQTDGGAFFVGYEHLTLSTTTHKGTMILQHSGQFINGVASSKFIIIEGSGTDDFCFVIGSGEFTSTENGQASYILSFSEKA